jgi:hypothetical protein
MSGYITVNWTPDDTGEAAIKYTYTEPATPPGYVLVVTTVTADKPVELKTVCNGLVITERRYKAGTHALIYSNKGDFWKRSFKCDELCSIASMYIREGMPQNKDLHPGKDDKMVHVGYTKKIEPKGGPIPLRRWPLISINVSSPTLKECVIHAVVGDGSRIKIGELSATDGAALFEIDCLYQGSINNLDVEATHVSDVPSEPLEVTTKSVNYLVDGSMLRYSN